MRRRAHARPAIPPPIKATLGPLLPAWPGRCSALFIVSDNVLLVTVDEPPSGFCKNPDAVRANPDAAWKPNIGAGSFNNAKKMNNLANGVVCINSELARGGLAAEGSRDGERLYLPRTPLCWV